MKYIADRKENTKMRRTLEGAEKVSWKSSQLDLEDGEGEKEEARGQIVGAFCLCKGMVSQESLAHSGNFRAFSREEMKKVG